MFLFLTEFLLVYEAMISCFNDCIILQVKSFYLEKNQKCVKLKGI